MIGSYTITQNIWPSLLTTVFLLALSLYSWHRRYIPGALPFTIGCLLGAMWAGGSVMEYAAVDVATKINWMKFQASMPLPLAVAVTCFFLEYTWPGRWLNRRNLALLSIPWFLSLVLILTNDRYHLVWHSFWSNGSLIPQFTFWAWIIIAYAYGLAILNIIVFGWLFLHSPQHRWPVVIMLTGLIGGRIIYLSSKLLYAHIDLPIDLLGMAFEFVMYAVALFGFHILDPIPFARQTAIVQMPSGILVLDLQGRVVSLNPAAEYILGSPASQIRGRQVSELLSIYPDVNLAEKDKIEIEINLPLVQRENRKAEKENRYYSLGISRLKDWRDLEVGRLLTLTDLTAQKRAQAQILEQQRAMATLEERERLARELHDQLAQDLAFINLQAQAACAMIESDQADQAEATIQRLAEITRQIQTDVRESISFLGATNFENGGFLEAFSQTVARFTQMTGIQVEMHLPSSIHMDNLDPTIQVQLLRIMQEALTNIRKHACANRAWVNLVLDSGKIELTIEDDGIGFEPGKLVDDSGSFGLRIMRERTEEIGGELQISAVPGGGTRIELQVPAKNQDIDSKLGKIVNPGDIMTTRQGARRI